MLPQSITSVVQAAIDTDRGVELDGYIIGRDPGPASSGSRRPVTRRATRRYRYAINLMPSSLLDPRLRAGRAQRQVRAAGLDPRQITIECTEQQAVADVGAARSAGSRRCAGSASASRSTTRAPATRASRSSPRSARRVIKIDRDIVHGISPQRRQAGARRGVRRRSGGGSARTCWPRASSAGPTWPRCTALGVELGQGYLLGRPALEPAAAAPGRRVDGRGRDRRPGRASGRAASTAGPAATAAAPPRSRTIEGMTSRPPGPASATFLDDLRFATIATTRSRRQRRARPSSGTRSTATRSSSTAPIGRRWPANLLRDPRISVPVTDGADGYRWVGLTGHGPRGRPTSRPPRPTSPRWPAATTPTTRTRPSGSSRDRFERQERVSFRFRPDRGPRPPRRATVPMTRFGLQLWSQQTDWPGFRDAALAAEAAGWDSVWTWDHLMAIFGPWEQPIFEGWSVAGRRSARSRRGVRLGLMVGANTFRNPGLTAKLATTLDHVSDGRAVLGIGGAWFEREHDGLRHRLRGEPGERLDRLDEAVMLMRRLLDGERFSHEGRVLHVRTTRCASRARSRRTCRSWSAGPGRGRRCGPSPCGPTAGTRAGASRRSRGTLDILGEHCADVGRDIATIEKTVSFPIVIRDDRRGGRGAYGALLAHNGVEDDGRRRRAARLARPRWPTRSGRTASWASRPSSSGCPRRTTARRSSGWPRSASSSRREGRRPRRRDRRREAGRRPPGRPPGGRPDGRRQHRRRHRAPRPARHARPRRGHVHAGRAVRLRARLGPAPARPGP